MAPRTRSYAVVAIAAVAAAIAAVAGLNAGALPLLDVVFVSSLFVLLGLGLRAAAIAWRSAHRAAEIASVTVRRSPEAAARAAVDEERARMSADIEAIVRRAVLGIRAHATALRAAVPAGRTGDAGASGPADPITADAAGAATAPTDVPADVPVILRAIQRDGRAATSELRRLLELLRTPGGDGAAAPEPTSAPAAAHPVRPRRLDVVLAVVAIAICLVELLAGPSLVPGGPVLLGVLLGVVAAAATLAWWTDPGAALAVQAAMVGIGALIGAPVAFGIWTVLAFGLPMWSAVARPRRGPLALAGPVALAVVGTWSQVLWSPENVGVLVAIITASALTGAASRLLESRRRRSTARAAEHDAVLEHEADAAVRRDRIATARELHDAVSATIGVIVMQAGAAELRWEADRRGAVLAIGVVVAAADQALEELDDLMPRLAGATIGGSAERGLADLPSMVARMRRAGVRVDVVLPEPVPPLPHDIAETAYRIAQEGVANAVRHAPGSRISVRIGVAGDDVVVSVGDDGAAVPTRSRRGYGLTGLAERVAEVGGELVAGPGDERGFHVLARLPVRSVEGSAA